MSTNTPPDERDDGIPCTLYLPRHWTERPLFRVSQAAERGGYFVRPGRWTDFASIPWFARAVFPPIDRYALSALVHDCALYDGLGWKDANAIFARGLCEDGVAFWRRTVIRAAVGANGMWQHARQRIGLGGRYV